MEILLFEVAGQQFGIRARDVSEVLRAVTLAASPAAPAAVEGLLNLRGRIVPVLDVRQLLRLPPQPMRHVDHLIVVEVGNHRLAVRVDRTLDLLEVQADGAEPVADDQLVAFVGRGPDGLIHVLETTRLVSADDVASFVSKFAGSLATEVTT